MKNFEAKRGKVVYTDVLKTAPENVFPLICPVGEEKWIFEWENDTYGLIYSESGINELGCIFKTSYPNGIPSLWTTVKFDKENYEIEFLVHVFDLIVFTYNVRLYKNEDYSTTIKSEYIVTAISENGNAVIDNIETIFDKTNSERRIALKYYVENGKKIKNLNDI
jgi:hypothetical protein